MGSRPARRWWVIGLVVVVALAGAALAVRRIWLDDQARTVGAQAALDAYREQQAAAQSSTSTVVASMPAASTTLVPRHATLPEPGVYRYLTTGHEHIDVLGGATHDYPAETLLTVVPDGCGVLLRWDLLVERREEWRLCVTPQGIELQTTGASYHEFFGRGELEERTCDRDVVLVPDDDLAHDPVPLACRLGTDLWLPEWQVLGRELRDVAGSQQFTYHVRMTVEDDDAYFEHTVIDYWLADTGLPVAMTCTTTSKSATDIVGDVVYDETFTADLADLRPMR